MHYGDEVLQRLKELIKMKMNKQIDNYILEHRDEMLRDIRDMISMPSYTWNRVQCRRVLDKFLAKADSMGMKTMKTKEGDVGIIEIGRGKETVGVLTHIDVVGIGDDAKWLYPPLRGTIAKGYIWGRGVVDGKGPAVMSLYALKAIKDLEIHLNKKIWLIVGTMEEGEWEDIENFKREFPLPKFGFAPDGDFPIYNREKGYCDVALSFKEPYFNEIEELKSGDSVNTIPSKAVMKIKGMDVIEIHGVSCHSSAPALGINAISKMAIETQELTEYNFMNFIRDVLGDDYCAPSLSIDDPLDEVKNQWEKTFVVPTVLKKKNDKVLLNINLRLAFGMTRDGINDAFRKFANEYNYEFEVCDFMEPMIVDENEDFLQIMSSVYGDYGYKSEFKTALGTTLAKAMPNTVSWGPVFETELSCAHMENERLNIESAIIATQMYASFLAKTAGPFGELQRKKENMTGLEKALFLLDLFTEPPYIYDVSALSSLTGMNRTTVYRNLTVLEHFGLLERNEYTRTYTIGKKSKEIWDSYNKTR